MRERRTHTDRDTGRKTLRQRGRARWMDNYVDEMREGEI